MGWIIKRFRFLFAESSEKIENEVFGDMLSVSGYRGIETKQYDDENRKRSVDELFGYRIVRSGQLVVNTMWMNYAGLGVSALNGHVSPAYRAYEFKENVDKQFAHYLLRSSSYVKAYTAFLTGVRPNSLQMSREDLMSFPVLLPPIAEQSAIAAFLDRETGKIDALVAEQERLIALLKEKRQAVISQAVTKGLNPNVPMKDAGVAWLGDVPAHWEVTRVKAMAKLVTSGPRGWSEHISDEGVIFIQSGDIDENLKVDLERAKRVNIQENAEAARSRARQGDVVICITGAKTGNVGVIIDSPRRAYINQHLSLVRPADNVVPLFLGYVLRSGPGQRHFEASQYGLKQGLSLDDVKDTPVALPPVSEQHEIIIRVEKTLEAIDLLTREVDEAVKLFHERRAALICAAVTGKIDIRKTAADAQEAA